MRQKIIVRVVEKDRGRSVINNKDKKLLERVINFYMKSNWDKIDDLERQNISIGIQEIHQENYDLKTLASNLGINIEVENAHRF